MKPEVKHKLEEALITIRNYLRRDNGDLEIVEFDEEKGLLKIRLLGNCKVCNMNDFTFQFGIQKTLFAKVPEVKEIIIVDDK